MLIHSRLQDIPRVSYGAYHPQRYCFLPQNARVTETASDAIIRPAHFACNSQCKHPVVGTLRHEWWRLPIPTSIPAPHRRSLQPGWLVVVGKPGVVCVAMGTIVKSCLGEISLHPCRVLHCSLAAFRCRCLAHAMQTTRGWYASS